jgi:predicted nucleotidyltransferase
MKEITMLDLSKIDLAELASALEDHSDDTSWWFDPKSGDLESRSLYLSSEEEETHPGDKGYVPVEPVPSGEGYGDMEEFIARVREPRARDLLQRAIEGRGAFRRFKDTLLDYPELRKAWFAFHDARTERRALEWLADHDVIDRQVAEREIARREDPDLPELGGAFDPYRVANEVAQDLRRLYGERLRHVILFGSWARGDAHPESDIDLLVVLDRIDRRWDELDRMDDILWRHSFSNDTVVTAVPVSEADFREARWPLLMRVRVEGQKIA